MMAIIASLLGSIMGLIFLVLTCLVPLFLIGIAVMATLGAIGAAIKGR